jgi:hypothetical protein
MVTSLYAASALVILDTAAASVLLAGIVVAAKQAAFLRASYCVNGRVVSEWRYRMRGRNRRYYRVQFNLSNGQSAELRSAVAGSSNSPRIGDTVSVRVREIDGKVNARIGTWVELWFESLVLLWIGGGGSLLMFAMTWRMVLASAL